MDGLSAAVAFLFPLSLADWTGGTLLSRSGSFSCSCSVRAYLARAELPLLLLSKLLALVNNVWSALNKRCACFTQQQLGTQTIYFIIIFLNIAHFFL